MENVFLNTISFKELHNWTVLNYTFEKNQNDKYSYVKIGRFLKRVKKSIEIQDEEFYKRATIKINNGGIFLRDIEQGKNIGTKNQYIVKEGQLLLSKIDARNGAFGIVPFELNNGVITGNFWVYDIDESQIIPQFLINILSSKDFQKIWDACSNGTTNRHYLQEDEFLNTKIPVPSLEEQQAILDRFKEKIQQSKAKLQTTWSEIDNYFITSLQASNFAIEEDKGFYFGTVELSSLTRWDSWKTSTGLKSALYKVVPFANLVVKKPQYGSNVKGVDKPCSYRYIRITDINENGTLNKDIKYPEIVNEDYVLQENDFLIARSGNTVGKTLLYKKEMGQAIYAGYLVRYLLNSKIVIPEYVLYYTKSVLFKNWVAKNQRIAGQPNINGQEYLTCPFILPPMEIQNEIVKNVKQLADMVLEEERLAFELQSQAKQEFESAIFGD